MPIAPTVSEQYSSSLGGGTKSDAFDEAPLKISYSKFTCTTAGTGTIKMVRLPAGHIRVHPGLSYYSASAMTATADLHIGFAAYNNQDGTAVAADDNYFADNVDIGGGADTWLVFPLPTGVAPVEFDSRDGIDIEVLIDTANCDLNDTIELWIAYQHAG